MTLPDQTPLDTPVPKPKPGWFRAGAARPVPVPRRLAVRVALALTSTTALLTTIAVVAAAAVVPPIGARRVARVEAQREVVAQLAPGEAVVARVFASQRRWTDFWRESYGIVVATNRRLLYVGAPPTPLLRPREDGPMALLTESYPYDAAFTLDTRALWRGRLRGLVLRTPARDVDFIVDDAEWPAAGTVARAAQDARRAASQASDRLDATQRAPLPPAEEYTTYTVRRGENLTTLAHRFGTSPDVLRQLNQLTTDEIRAGQRLRVPKVAAPDDSAR